MPKKILRVFFDAFELSPGVGKSIGIYNYAKNLLREIANIGDPAIQFIVACNPAGKLDFGLKALNFEILVLGSGVPNKISRQLWLRGGAALQVQKSKADIYFSPKGFLPNGLTLCRGNIRSVVVIHDLIPLWYADQMPGYFGWLEEFLVNGGLIKSACKANQVIAISQATKSDLETRLNRKTGIEVIPNGVPFTAAGKSPLESPYIFSVTSTYPHKNSKTLIEAYALYRKSAKNPLPLVVCGIEQPAVEGVIALKNLSDADLHGCYASARLFVFLSLIEGFGFPPLEAISHGTEVLCSNIPSLLEVTKGLATYVDPKSPLDVCAQLLKILDKPAPERDLVASSVETSSWGLCAARVLEVLKKH